MTEAADVLLVEEHSNGHRVVRLNRPDRLNALTPEMVDGITAAVTVGAEHRAPGTGTGLAFSAGVDIAASNGRQKGRSNAQAFEMQERFAAMILAIHRSRVPIVAAINGPAAGAGLAIALASDIRIVAASARFIIGAPNIGLSAGECGISYFLPRIIGLGRASAVMLTNRHMYAKEALNNGLVTQVVPANELETAAQEICKSITLLSPFAVKMTKQVYRMTIDSTTLEQALELENRTQILANGTNDAREAREAFLEKRSPHFGGT